MERKRQESGVWTQKRDSSGGKWGLIWKRKEVRMLKEQQMLKGAPIN